MSKKKCCKKVFSLKSMRISTQCKFNDLITAINTLPKSKYNVYSCNTSKNVCFEVSRKLFLYRNSFNPIIDCNVKNLDGYAEIDLYIHYKYEIIALVLAISLFAVLYFVIVLLYAHELLVLSLLWLAMYITFITATNVYTHYKCDELVNSLLDDLKIREKVICIVNE